MEGIPFKAAVKKFLEWLRDRREKFCTWGSADLVELQRNLKYYRMLSLLKGPVFYYDVQKLFGLIYENEKNNSFLRVCH